METKKKKYLISLVALLLIIFWIILLTQISPSEIVAKLGVGNTYLVLFLISAIGGVSVATGASYYIIIFVLALAELNPIFLGLVGGLGVTIGDSLYFYLGLKGKEVSPGKFEKKLEKIRNALEKSPQWFIPFFVYIYSGFTPLSNDMMTFTLGITGYPFKKIIFPLVLGNITATIIIAYLALYGINLF